MPAWEAELSEEQRWHVVNFLRTLNGHADENHEHEDEEEHSD